MQKAIKDSFYVLLWVFGLTAALTIAGLAFKWFVSPDANMPYLSGLVAAVLVEAAGVILFVAKRGVLYMPEVTTNKNSKETSKFMVDFLSNGSSATIVSNRLGWLVDDKDVVETMQARLNNGMRLEIITAQPVPQQIRQPLEALGAKFYEVPGDVPEARFTLVNPDRNGSERLAIARGTHPAHEITVFDSSSGPQIIGMAKDIVRKSKAVAVA